MYIIIIISESTVLRTILYVWMAQKNNGAELKSLLIYTDKY